MERYLNRKALLTTLGVAGLGLGLVVSAVGGAPTAYAQEENATPSVADVREELRSGELRARFYAEFTAALGEELGVSDSAQIDTAIRDALATVVDGLESDGLLTAGKAEAVKSLLATLEAPVKPGPMFGPHGGMFIARLHAGVGPGGEDGEIAGEVAEATEGPRAIAQRFYPDFTAALAAELGSDADEVDGAIRLAMMTVIDNLEADALPIPVSTDALKSLVATADSPLSPGLVFGPPPGMIMRALHERHGKGHFFPGMGDDREWTIRVEGGPWADQEAEPAADQTEDASDDSQTNDEAEAGSS